MQGCGSGKPGLSNVDSGTDREGSPDGAAGDDAAADAATEARGGTDGGAGMAAPDAPPAVPFEDYRAGLAEATCTYYVRCNFFPDIASCISAYPPDSEFLTVRADVQSGLVVYDGRRVRACFDAIAAQDCAFSIRYTQWSALDACDAQFTGTLAQNQTCYSDLECAPGTICQIPDCGVACCPGGCVVPAALGEPCTTRPCAKGTYCNAQTRLCSAPSMTEGAACTVHEACGGAMLCVPGATGTAKTCIKKLPGTGAICNQAVGCDDYRDVCSASNLCVRGTGLGKACTTEPDNCVGYGWCNGTLCQAFGAEGETCQFPSDTGNPDCLGDLVCARPALKCLAPPPETSCR